MAVAPWPLMLLAIDIGNTNTVLGMFKGDELAVHWRLASRSYRTADEYGIIIKEFFLLNNIEAAGIDGVIISCVVPPMLPVLEEMSKKYFKITPLIVGEKTKTGLSILYDNPEDVGADRIVNAVAGLKKFGGPLIIVDFGTAITFDVVSEKEEYLGGLIFPGITISMDALFNKAAKLPRIDLVSPKKTIGKNTIESIQSGAFYGYANLVDGVVKEIRKEMRKEIRAISTGGQAELISKHSTVIEDYCPLLTLEGLKIIYDKNTTV